MECIKGWKEEKDKEEEIEEKRSKKVEETKGSEKIKKN
jgi:hypothetical protein